MARQADKELVAYKNGLAKALEIVRAGGIEALEKEIEFRNVTYCPAYIPMSKYQQWEKETTGLICESVCVLMLNCVMDEFEFGPKRLRRVMDRFNSYSTNIDKGYVDWQGIIDCVEQEGKIDIEEIKNVFDRPATGDASQCYPEQKKLRKNGTE